MVALFDANVSGTYRKDKNGTLGKQRNVSSKWGQEATRIIIICILILEANIIALQLIPIFICNSWLFQFLFLVGEIFIKLTLIAWTYDITYEKISKFYFWVHIEGHHKELTEKQNKKYCKLVCDSILF